MKVLGLYGSFGWDANSFNKENWIHDSGATLIIDGNHICSISEERLTRIKYDGNFPIQSINYCLSLANISPEDIDLVCIPSMPIPIFYEYKDNNLIHQKVNEIFPKAKIKIFSHHLCHAASSIFRSDFNEGSFFTSDGGGSIIFHPHKKIPLYVESNSIGYFNKSKNIFKIYPTLPYTNNFGKYFSWYSGKIYYKKTKSNKIILDVSVCGKIMGLSGYGNLQQYDWKDYHIVEDQHFPLVVFNEFESSDRYISKSPEDMASTLQKNFETSIVDYLSILRKKSYLTKNVCFSGGTFLNVIANSCIKKSNLFENIYIPPYTNDSGLHFGSACYGVFQTKEKILLTENHALVGKKYSDEEILEELNVHNIKFVRYKSFEDLCTMTASYLCKNKIIAWFQNRSEFGPRALGSRSLLMNPTPENNKNILNLKVKHREYWRPFAGVILEEYFSEYFEENFTSDYMLYSFTIKNDKIKNIKSIAHIDNTCRVQTVNKKLNPELTLLLNKYKKISGIPILLNTSFNDNGEPIVESPKDAIESFIKMNIDYLVIGNFIVQK